MTDNLSPSPLRPAEDTSGASGLRARLADWLGLRPTNPDLVAVIAGLQAEVGALHQTLVGLQTQVDRLEKQQARTGKEQYKANLLAESQQQSAKDVLAQLKDHEAYRERELAALREQLISARGEGRVEVARQIFAAVDSLDQAIAGGERWLVQRKAAASQPHRGASESEPALSLLARLLRPAPPVQRLPSNEPDEDVHALSTWLEGLDLIRRRLLDVLAGQGILPMDPEGARFDPARHVVVETVPASAQVGPGQVVQVHQRGYLRGETVLRYAEVVVARKEQG